MPAAYWLNGKQTSPGDSSAWVGGVLPPAGAVWVIRSAGDGAGMPVPGGDPFLINPTDASSAIYLFDGFLLTMTTVIDNAGLETFFTAPPSAVSPGVELAKQTIDLSGAGGVSAMILQDSAFDASTLINVSGDAYMSLGYTNVLAGMIDVGLPFTIDGAPVPTAPADADGATSNLNLDVNAYGSWDDAGNLTSYIPTTTNDGLMTVGFGSLINISIAGSDALTSGTPLSPIPIFHPPDRSEFANEGTIDVLAGGALFVNSPGDRGLFLNDGTISIAGGPGARTTAEFAGGTLSGSGFIIVAGGSSTDRAQTAAAFRDTIAGQTFAVSDATLQFAAMLQSLPGGANPTPTYDTVTGGVIVFADTNAALDLTGTDGNIVPGPFVSGFTDTIEGFQAGDSITVDLTKPIGDFSQYSFVDAWDQASGQLEIGLSFTDGATGGQLVEPVALLRLQGVYDASHFSLAPLSGDGSSAAPFTTTLTTTDSLPCFAAGVRIRTDKGEVAVEDLRVGDVAITHASYPASGRIAWIGRLRVDVAGHPSPERVRPIMVAAGALGDGCPARPLLLSPDHALFVDGLLVAARQLVNGRSVCPANVPSVEYFHVELDRHAVLFANSAPCESYLDTGNRTQFGGGAATALHSDFYRGEHSAACAPLATDPARVRPVWDRIASRAGLTWSEPEVSRDPRLALVLPGGNVAFPDQIEADGRHAFHFEPLGASGEARLLSRSGTPAELRPWLDDRRSLGVRVAKITVWTARRGPVSADVTDQAEGWWALEDGSRWTDGDASVPLPAHCTRLDIRIVATGEYPYRSIEQDAAAAA